MTVEEMETYCASKTCYIIAATTNDYDWMDAATQVQVGVIDRGIISLEYEPNWMSCVLDEDPIENIINGVCPDGYTAVDGSIEFAAPGDCTDSPTGRCHMSVEEMETYCASKTCYVIAATTNDYDWMDAATQVQVGVVAPGIISLEYEPNWWSCVMEMPCQVSEWAEGACSVTCGAGQRINTRTVIQEPIGEGAPCPSDLSETVPCDTGVECPVPCEL